MKRDYMTLADYDVKAGDTVYIQDKGIQVSYRLVIFSKIIFSVQNPDKFRTYHYLHTI